MTKEFRFSKSQRLLNSSEFSKVFDDASIKVHHSDFLILATPNALDYPRLGLVIAKKHVRLAVNRNKIKRAVRESFRKKQHHLPAIDAIVLARRNSDLLTNNDVLKIFDNLWNRTSKKAAKLRQQTTIDS